MIDADRPLFSRAMTRLFAIYNDELTDALLHAWWGALEGYTLEDVQAAMSAHATDPKAGMFRPTPAHIVNHLTTTLAERRRFLEAQRAQALDTAIDPHDRAIRQLCNDVRLGLITPEDYAAKRADHVRAIAQIRTEHKRLSHDP